MKTEEIGFAIIGTGAIARIHATAVAAIDNAVLVGVYNRSRAKATAFGEEFGCVAYDSMAELLQVSNLTIVCICTPSGTHLEPALQCIAAGKHCLIEKPLEVTLEKSDQIIAAAKANNLIVAVVYPSRFYDVIRELKKAIDTNRFGNMVLGSAYVKWSRTEAYYKSADWRGSWELDGGGALMNQGIHSVDMLQWCMGPVVSVQAISANIRHKNIEVEDTVVALLQFANGALGTIECSTATYPGVLKRLEIMGTSGTVVLEDNDVVKWQFEYEDAGDREIINNFSPTGNAKGGASDPLSISYLGHQRQMEDLIQAINTGQNTLIDAVEGRRSVAIVLAIYESARTGKPVKP